MSNANAPITIFSLLFNEEDSFLDVYISNFLFYTGEDCLLIVNLPPGRLMMTRSSSSDRVVCINGAVKRQKWGETLLAGHLETLGYALQRWPEAGFFCTLASNSLFVRMFDVDACTAELRTRIHSAQIRVTDLPQDWHWKDLAKCDLLLSSISCDLGLTHLSQNQIEGFFASADDWKSVLSYFDKICALGPMILPGTNIPLEEILPSSIISRFGSGRFLNACHNFWDRYKEYGGRVRISDLLSLTVYPSYVSIMKWFDRREAAPVTAAVTLPWSQHFLLANRDSGTRRHSARKLLNRMLLEQFTFDLRVSEKYEALSRDWWRGSRDAGCHLAIHQASLVARRQRLSFTGWHSGLAPEAEPYVLLEDTGHRVNLIAEIVAGSAGYDRVDVACSGDQADQTAQNSALEGYVYFELVRHADVQCFRLRMASSSEQAERSSRRVVIVRDGDYQVVEYQHKTKYDHYTEYYFIDENAPSTAAQYAFGVPFFMGEKLSILCDCLMHTAPAATDGH